MRSWDKFVIPKPFGKIDFYVGEPIDVLDMEMEEAKELILKEMNKHQLRK